ncbi:MAG: hypothetical protein HY821_24920 [Acidobacteria bacterium]|nr:hypothetical protein [Acidobacteriota bacterium]
MATAAQISANQNNAQLSTGPRTAQGKQASARNATRHGMCSREFVILEGEQDSFDQLMADLQAALQPGNAYELELFRHIAHAAWTLRRCRIAEASMLFNPKQDPLIDPCNEIRIRQIDTYARRAERTFHQASKALRDVQTERRYREESCPRPENQQESPVHDDAVLISYSKILPTLRSEIAAGQRDADRQFKAELEAFLAPPAVPSPQPKSANAGACPRIEQTNPIPRSLTTACSPPHRSPVVLLRLERPRRRGQDVSAGAPNHGKHHRRSEPKSGLFSST